MSSKYHAAMVGTGRGPLVTSLALTLVSYGIVETLGYFAVGRLYGIPGNTFALFFAVQWVFQAVLGVGLYLGRNAFVIEKTGEKLTRVNAANKVTLFRVSMLPSLLFLIIDSQTYGTTPVTIGALSVTFITDMIDGKLSRALNQVTRMGRILDSVSDYALLGVVAIAYQSLRILPNWLFVLIMFRLFIHAFGMLVILIVRGRVDAVPTPIGKVAIATTMTLFALETLRWALHASSVVWLGVAEKVAGTVVAVSIFDKAIFFLAHVRGPFSRRVSKKD